MCHLQGNFHPERSQGSSLTNHLLLEYGLLLMQLAIDEDRQVQEPSEGVEMKARAGGAQRRSDDWACRYHQWQSRITREVPK